MKNLKQLFKNNWPSFPLFYIDQHATSTITIKMTFLGKINKMVYWTCVGGTGSASLELGAYEFGSHWWEDSINHLISQNTSCWVCQVDSVLSDSLQPRGLQPARLHCPWDSPGEKNGVGCCALLQGTFLTQGSNPISCLLYWQAGSLPLAPSRPVIKRNSDVKLYSQGQF